MSDSLYENISRSQTDSEEIDEGQDEKNQKTWLLFKSEGGTYAIDSLEIREVLRNHTIYPLPFTPDYIKGVVNYSGKPFAVVDFAILQGLEKTNARFFLVLGGDDDIAIQVMDIVEFYSAEDVEEQILTDRTEADLFSHTINIGKVIVPVIDVNALVKKVKVEIENS